MIFEVSNPSDPVTLESEDEVLASVATMLLGEGFYGLEDESGKTVLRILAFGGEGALGEWCKEKGVADFNEYVEANKSRLAECLDTAVVAGIGQRKSVLAAVDAAGGDKKKGLAAYNEERRSSMNNICKRATQIAEHFRKKAGV